jgi:BMFP domain-containing protein YqiC
MKWYTDYYNFVLWHSINNFKTNNMKWNIYISLALIGFMSVSCIYKKQAEQLTRQNTQLTINLEERDSVVNLLNDVITTIQSNLNLLYDRNKELNLLEANDQYTDIEKKLVQNINDLMKENRTKFESLQNMLVNSRYKGSELIKTVDELNGKIKESEIRFEQLNKKISGLEYDLALKDSSVRHLTELNTEKDKRIGELNSKLNTAYYIIGDKKSLKNQKVLIKKGGFLKSVDELKPGVDKGLFTKIDIHATTHISILQELGKIRLITPHSPNSYTIKSNNEKSCELEITKPDEFWEASKYLVIQI